MAACVTVADWNPTTSSDSSERVFTADAGGLSVSFRASPPSAPDAFRDYVENHLQDIVGMDRQVSELSYTDMTIGGLQWKELRLEWADRLLIDYILADGIHETLEVAFNGKADSEATITQMAGPVVRSMSVQR